MPLNVTALVGTDGTALERYLYDPYGNVTFLKADWSLQEVSGHEDGTASAYDNPILFAGYWRDSETALYHVRNRMYHSPLGLWLIRDPEGYVDGMSLYEYVRSGPTLATDALGLLTDKEIQSVVGAQIRQHLKVKVVQDSSYRKVQGQDSYWAALEFSIFGDKIHLGKNAGGSPKATKHFPAGTDEGGEARKKGLIAHETVGAVVHDMGTFETHPTAEVPACYPSNWGTPGKGADVGNATGWHNVGSMAEIAEYTRSRTPDDLRAGEYATRRWHSSNRRMGESGVHVARPGAARAGKTVWKQEKVKEMVDFVRRGEPGPGKNKLKKGETYEVSVKAEAGLIWKSTFEMNIRLKYDGTKINVEKFTMTYK